MTVILIVASLNFARACYSRAARFERQHGAGPWGGGPVLWGFVGLMLGLVGFVILAIAEKNTKNQARANAAWSTPAYVPSLPPRPNVGGSDFLPGRN